VAVLVSLKSSTAKNDYQNRLAKKERQPITFLMIFPGLSRRLCRDIIASTWQLIVSWL